MSAAVVWGNISIPLVWLLLNKKGNSSTAERKKLIEQMLSIIPHTMIEVILADREFVCEEWLEYLSTYKTLPFAIRIKKNEQIRHANGGKVKLNQYFNQMKIGEFRTTKTNLYQIPVKITCLQLAKEPLFIVSNCFAN